MKAATLCSTPSALVLNWEQCTNVSEEIIEGSNLRRIYRGQYVGIERVHSLAERSVSSTKKGRGDDSDSQVLEAAEERPHAHTSGGVDQVVERPSSDLRGYFRSVLRKASGETPGKGR